MAFLKRQFDDDAIIELTALIAFQNMSSKLNTALDVPPQGFCRLPAPDAAEPARAFSAASKRPGPERNTGRAVAGARSEPAGGGPCKPVRRARGLR
jgi:hypothetical protein